MKIISALVVLAGVVILAAQQFEISIICILVAIWLVEAEKLP